MLIFTAVSLPLTTVLAELLNRQWIMSLGFAAIGVGLVALIVGRLRSRLARRGARQSLHHWASTHGGHLEPRPVHPSVAGSTVEVALRATRTGLPEEPSVCDWVHGQPGGRYAEAFFLTGKNGEVAQFVVIEAPHLPWLELDRREVGTRPGQQFESHSFNEDFAVRSENPRFASDVIHPRLMQLLENGPSHLALLVLAEGVLVSRTECALDASALDEQITLMFALVDALPSFVVDDYRLS